LRTVIPEPRLVALDEMTVAVREWGPADGRPLVAWHALGPATSGAIVAEVAPELASRHGVRTVALDAPGHGASPALPRER
jgi:pimeloyl-ACP methyl ester carboxylesterase